jgi:hypothetical protein
MPRLLALTVSSLLLGSMPAQGQTAAPAPDPTQAADEWHFELTPYIWATAITGTVGAKGNTADVSVPFSDILDDLNFGFMGVVEARNDRFIVLLDGFGALLEDDVDVGAKTVSVPAFPLVDATIGPSHVDVKLTQVIVDLKLGWRVLSLPTASLLGEAPASDDTRLFSLDLLGGGRYWYLKTEVDLKVPVSLGVGLPPGTPLPPGLGDLELPSLTTDGLDKSIDADADWIDPVVGARGTLDLTEGLSLSLLGDVGGFDIGSASKFTWKANALIEWKLSERCALVAGYQGLNLQREKGDAEVDITMYGPVVGLGFEF